MGSAPVAVELPAEEGPSGWVRENPLVRGVQRIPRPLSTKHLVAFGLIAALLGLVAAVGLVALSQSNSRGKRLQKLEATEAYVQQLKSDANLLQVIGARRVGYAFGYFCGTGSGCQPFGHGYRKAPAVLVELDTVIAAAASQFLADLQGPALTGSKAPLPSAEVRRLRDELNGLQTAYATITLHDNTGQGGLPRSVKREQTLASNVFSDLSTIATSTSAQAQELVAANQSSFNASQSLLLGVAGGSLLLALALGLLLSWSVVVPLRRTRMRLAAIAERDFSGHVEVPNRDEIGGLATDVNRMSDELQRVYRELERASEHKSQFVTNMSHELRTPLNAIIGFSDVLHEQMFGELNERQLAYVDDIREAGRHQLSLINELLDLAKIEAGRMELKLSQVAVPDVLRAAVAMHAERASRGGIELSLATEPEEIVVTADELRVRQVVYNLLSNAVKFTPPKGRIEISAHAVDGHVEVAVADTGPGLYAEDLETIFEEFGQTSEGKQAEGTGLGLPLSRKLVELHGGRLWAESEPGHGSTFRFTLPIGQNT